MVIQLIFLLLSFYSNTSGVKCTWSGGGHLEVDLHHCHDPVNYHIAIKAPSKNLLKNVSVQEGDSINLFKKDKVGEVKLHVKKLSRTGNIVSTSVSLMSVFD